MRASMMAPSVIGKERNLAITFPEGVRRDEIIMNADSIIWGRSLMRLPAALWNMRHPANAAIRAVTPSIDASAIAERRKSEDYENVTVDSMDFSVILPAALDFGGDTETDEGGIPGQKERRVIFAHRK